LLTKAANLLSQLCTATEFGQCALHAHKGAPRSKIRATGTLVLDVTPGNMRRRKLREVLLDVRKHCHTPPTFFADCPYPRAGSKSAAYAVAAAPGST